MSGMQGPLTSGDIAVAGLKKKRTITGGCWRVSAIKIIGMLTAIKN